MTSFNQKIYTNFVNYINLLCGGSSDRATTLLSVNHLILIKLLRPMTNFKMFHGAHKYVIDSVTSFTLHLIGNIQF